MDGGKGWGHGRPGTPQQRAARRQPGTAVVPGRPPGAGVPCRGLPVRNPNHPGSARPRGRAPPGAWRNGPSRGCRRRCAVRSTVNQPAPPPARRGRAHCAPTRRRRHRRTCRRRRRGTSAVGPTSSTSKGWLMKAGDPRNQEGQSAVTLGAIRPRAVSARGRSGAPASPPKRLTAPPTGRT